MQSPSLNYHSKLTAARQIRQQMLELRWWDYWTGKARRLREQLNSAIYDCWVAKRECPDYNDRGALLRLIQNSAGLPPSRSY